EYFIDEYVQVNSFKMHSDLTGFNLRKREQILHEHVQPVKAFRSFFEEFHPDRLVVDCAIENRMHKSLCRKDGCLQLMRNISDKLATKRFCFFQFTYFLLFQFRERKYFLVNSL